MRRIVLAVAVASVALAILPTAASADSAYECNGEFPSEGVEMRDGPRLRFGVTPSGAAGQIGPAPSEFARDRPRRILAALDRLRPRRGPFVTHVYTSWSDAGRKETRRLAEIIDRYSRSGYLVELVLRYKPSAEQEGDVRGYARYVRRMVRRFGRNPRVVAFQVTNEVNVTFSPDSSDGAFDRARDALVRGIIAGDAAARRRGYDQLEVGFNWLYRTDPSSEQTFWDHLRERGGRRFVRALDWIGLDAYPGTFFPPAVPPPGATGDARDALVNALSTFRCLSEIANVPHSVPIHVQENGFPTGPGRSEEQQKAMLRQMVTTFHDFRGTYNVSDYRWFNMRDADTSSPNFQQHYGLLEDDYAKKAAFGEYRRLIDQLSIGERGLDGEPHRFRRR